MTHDPICPAPTAPLERRDPRRQCQCALIAKVRADTIARMAQSVKAVRADERQRIIGVMERNADGDALKVIDAVLGTS